LDPLVRQRLDTHARAVGRMATPDDVAEQAVLALSDAASLMTGHALAVDGGELVS
jgi:NAD(P)-dependent dehydrogenase (short-subunit alcohol dehydrogenase family)